MSGKKNTFILDDSDLFKRMGKDSKKNKKNIIEILEKIQKEN